MLETEIKKLTAAVEALTKAVQAEPLDVPQSEPTPEPTPKAKAEVKPTPETDVETTLSHEEVRDITVGLTRRSEGDRDAVKAKLATFGVSKVNKLDDAQLVEFNAWVEAQL